MTTYLTWIPDEVGLECDLNGVPRQVAQLRPFNAARPAAAAARAALRVPANKHPYSIEIAVMRADHLGESSFRLNRYTVRFARTVKTVEPRK